MSTTTSAGRPRAPRLIVARDWEQVVDAAVEVLTGPTDDPFSLPLLVTPSRAHALALAQQVARRRGVAAGLSGRSPAGCAPTSSIACWVWPSRATRGGPTPSR
ncbi:hypothetical protein [Acidipropionibacterium acidipropionici]|uniref:hypothetical protein n=1 Tax=Acidipropionibacterium acidipropionici TaxID=1748 RepID=UPI00110AAB16|nr:hypothetical protein [Acidipropionibacterium acidipropionici]QCV94859.1 hypothetical protein FEZ30_05910 [Acidipropionibacterium acidipropionici]